MGAHYASSIYHIEAVCLYAIPVLFRRLRPPSISKDSDRFLATLHYETLPCHTRLISPSSPLTHPVPPCIFTFSYYVSPTPYCCATRAHICSHALLLPTTCTSTCISLLSGRPGPLHEIAVSAFSRSPLGRADTSLQGGGEVRLHVTKGGVNKLSQRSWISIRSVGYRNEKTFFTFRYKVKKTSETITRTITIIIVIE